MPPLEPVPTEKCLALFLNNNRVEALGFLDIHRLHVAVQLLLGILLVVSSSGNSDAESVGNALDAALPDLLVELGVQADVGGALGSTVSISVFSRISTIILRPIWTGCTRQLSRRTLFFRKAVPWTWWRRP